MDTLFWRDLLCTALGLSVLVGIVWLCVWMVRRAVKVKRCWLRWTMRLVGFGRGSGGTDLGEYGRDFNSLKI